MNYRNIVSCEIRFQVLLVKKYFRLQNCCANDGRQNWSKIVNLCWKTLKMMEKVHYSGKWGGDEQRPTSLFHYW